MSSLKHANSKSECHKNIIALQSVSEYHVLKQLTTRIHLSKCVNGKVIVCLVMASEKCSIIVKRTLSISVTSIVHHTLPLRITFSIIISIVSYTFALPYLMSSFRSGYYKLFFWRALLRNN